MSKHKQAPFDDKANRDLLRYVKRQYRDRKRISKVAFQVYRDALAKLEREQLGFCQTVTMSHDRIADYADCSKNSVGPSCQALLEVGLIEYQRGESGPGSGLAASKYRRRTIEEVKAGSTAQQVEPDIMPDAAELACLLSRPLLIQGEEVMPHYNANRIGRIHSRGWNVQGMQTKQREAAFLSAIRPGSILLSVDLKKAEPFVVNNLLEGAGLSVPGWPDDPYQMLASIAGIKRDEAKNRLNAMTYCKNSEKAFISTFGVYGESLAAFIYWSRNLDALKMRIRAEAKQANPLFSVKTIAGRKIIRIGKKQIHGGMLLSWIAQGSIADAIVPACLEIIRREQIEGWKLLLNLHDGFYVELHHIEQEAEVQGIVRDKLLNAGIDFLDIVSKTVSLKNNYSPQVTTTPLVGYPIFGMDSGMYPNFGMDNETRNFTKCSIFFDDYEAEERLAIQEADGIYAGAIAIDDEVTFNAA